MTAITLIRILITFCCVHIVVEILLLAATQTNATNEIHCVRIGVEFEYMYAKY